MAQSKTEARNHWWDFVSHCSEAGILILACGRKRDTFYARTENGEAVFKYVDKPTYRSPEDEEAYSEWS
jgi:hypothetical protein